MEGDHRDADPKLDAASPDFVPREKRTRRGEWAYIKPPPTVLAGLSPGRKDTSPHETWLRQLVSAGAHCYHDPDGTKITAFSYSGTAPDWMPDPKGPAPGAHRTSVFALASENFACHVSDISAKGLIATGDAPRAGTIGFSVLDLPPDDSLLEYDHYRIDEIQFRISSPYAKVTRAVPLSIVVDRYDRFLSFMDLRNDDYVIDLNPGQSVDLVFRPRLLKSGGFASAGDYWEDPGQWTAIAEPQVHFGLRVFVPPASYCFNAVWAMSARYKVSLRNDSL